MERLKKGVSGSMRRLFLLIMLTAMTLPIVVGNAFANPPAPVPKTGQTTCYDANGGVIACAGTGQDGEKQAGVAWPSPRFTDNGNGTITDNLTGLVWLKNANCFGWRNWVEALNDANTLQHGQCGLSDGSTAGQWRLPNRKELRSLIDYSKYSRALPNGHPFTNVSSYGYWSSTTHAYDTDYAWFVYMWYGYVSYDNRGGSYYVWAVRSGSGGSFYNLVISKAGTGSGTVTSNPTGINCGSTCSASFASGTTVTLTATAASGSTFAGWSGACSGSSSNCTLTMNAGKNVTATFTGTLPSAVTVTPSSGNWASSPQGIRVSSNGATAIYFKMVNTYNGSTPSDSADPTPTSNDGSISGSSGVFSYYGSTGNLKKTKIKFVGCNSFGCGPVSGVLSYEMDLRGHVSVSSLNISPTPVKLGQDFTVNFSLKEVRGFSKTFQKVAVAILKEDGQLLFDCRTYDNVVVGANQTWSNSATCQIYRTNLVGTYKVIIRGKLDGGNWFDFDTTGSGINPLRFTAETPVAQSVQIYGTVKMGSIMVSGATVTLTNETTRETRTTTSDVYGRFIFTVIIGNRYSLKAEYENFWICSNRGIASGSVLPFDMVNTQSQTQTIQMQCPLESVVIVIPGIMGSTGLNESDVCIPLFSLNNGCYPNMPSKDLIYNPNSLKILSPMIPLENDW